MDALLERVRLWVEAAGIDVDIAFADERCTGPSEGTQTLLAIGPLTLSLTGAHQIPDQTKRTIQIIAELVWTEYQQTLAQSILVHEIRNPLAVVAGQVELLRREIGPHPRLASIERAVGRIEQQLKTSQGIPDGFWSEFAVAEVLDQILTDLAPLADGKHIRWLLAVKTVTVYWNRETFWQILFNLVKNAIEAAPPHGIVELGATSYEHGVRVWVKTHGVDIPPEVKARLFRQPASVKGPDRGVGLLLSRNLATESGAELVYDDKTGFTLLIPSRTSRQK